MANTIMTAKNTFAEGLIMDFAPDNTQATCMTSALNATLLTFNGNEMSLLNDMGNGRVETARLPEGYVPVGTCEFGDIIYIVSYNPITNKSQIGCFPSPERNISSDELSQIELSIDYTEFLNISMDGTLKRTSIKKVLIGNKKLNPGDKYIIYTDYPDSINGSNSNLLSDWGAGRHNVDPKTVKLHVVSIEDSGKITYLDSTTKWYENYYVNTSKQNTADPNSPPDIDSYRNLLSSGWSIFSSKVPGKLAILAELETIDAFSCSYLVDMIGEPEQRGNIIYKKYKIKLIPHYDEASGITLPYICATKATFNNNNIGLNTETNSVNYFSINLNKMETHTAVLFESNSSTGWKVETNDTPIEIDQIFEIPYKEIYKDKEYPIYSDSFIYNLEITPAMDFGRLDYLKVLLTIDFNKIGTGDIDFNIWKYHNSEESAMLTFGINTYPKPGYEVKCIVMDFYDNQGKVMQYLLDGRKSYNGVFNEYFSLNGKNSNSRMSRYELDMTKPDWSTKPSEWKNNDTKTINGREVSANLILHKGETLEEPLEFNDEFIEETLNNKTVYYQNDAGILYYGALYAVKISIYQGIINDGKVTAEAINLSIGEPKVYYRWYWTTPMFNEYYYNTNDFGTLKFELILNSTSIFETNPSTYIWKSKEINNLGEDFGLDEFFRTYSANILYIGKDKEPNINMYVRAGLLNDYGCFNLYDKELSNIKTEVFLSTGNIKYDLRGDEYVFSGEYGNITDPWFLYKELDIVKTEGSGLSGMGYIDSAFNNSKVSNQNERLLKDDFNITFPTNSDDLPEGATLSSKTITDDNELQVKCPILTTTLDKCYYLNNDKKEPIQLCMAATIFNKAYVLNIYTSNIAVPVYLPIIDNVEDFYLLGIDTIAINGNVKMCFRGAINLNHKDDLFTITNFNFDTASGTFVSPAESDDEIDPFTIKDTMVDPSTNKEFVEKEWSYVSALLPEMFLVYPGGNRNTHCYGIVSSGPYSYIDVTKWYLKHLLGSPDYGSSGTKAQITPDKTGRAYDIANGAFSGINQYNAVPFLGMKYKEGFTLLNSAFKETPTELFFTLVAETGGEIKEYENFAYLLYLLLSNTYHKNKRAADTQINLKNYVRNGDSNITFTKNIVVRLSENDPTLKNNIIMRGVDFNEYIKVVEEKSGIEPDSPNVVLRFIDSAINNVLTVSMKSVPISFTDTNAQAYIMRNGTLKPTINLANNTFYVYQNDELLIYLNKLLTFNIEEVGRNLKYLLSPQFSDDEVFKNTTSPKLYGVHPPQIEYLTEHLIAYNDFVDAVNNAVFEIGNDRLGNDEYFTGSHIFDTPELLRDKKNSFISAIMDRLSDSFGGYSKQYLQYYAYNNTPNTLYGPPYDLYGWYGAFEVFFDARPLPIQEGSSMLYVDKHVLEIGTRHRGMEKETSYRNATEYTFNCHFNLTRAFSYDTKLTLNTERTYSKFGIKDDPADTENKYNQAYGGFMLDVIIDKEFLVVP